MECQTYVNFVAIISDEQISEYPGFCEFTELNHIVNPWNTAGMHRMNIITERWSAEKVFLKDPWTWLTLLITHKLFFVRTLTLFSRYSKEKCKGRLFFPGLCRKASFEKFISIPIFLMHILSLVLVATVWAEGQLLESPLKWYSVGYARMILKFAHKNQGPTWRSFQSLSIFPTLE